MEHAKQLELELEPEQQLEQLLKKLELVDLAQLPETFQAHFQGKQRNICCVEDFAIYFLAALRQHTELHFRGNYESETPKQHTPVHQAKPMPIDQELNESPLSQLSTCNVSTPVRQVTPLQQQGRRSTGGTPQSSERSTNRSGGGGGSSSFCLADFMTNTTPNQSQQRAKKKTTPLDKSQRPRRRVLPMTISRNVSASSSFGDTSSFSNENNLLRLSQSCELDRSQGAELEQEARKMLLLRRQEIKSEAPVEQEREQRERDVQPKVMSISLEHVRHAKQLQLLAAIYALLMDLNLVPNVLTEISYALQLLNICDVADDSSKSVPPLALLAGHKECIYFAAKLLEQQKDVLLQLDRSSLAVLLQHDRLSLLSKQLQDQLEQQQSQRARIHLPAVTPSKAQQNVHYQHEKDARDKFPSQQEFGAFKSQRDLFYKSLKQWEQLHLNRLFSFGRELGPLVRDIFKQSEHVVNMAHFAGLFVSQLLMSSREKHESPEELGLKLDQQRLNRLAQRLVTSNSSVEDQFPRTQAFFRDFIGECSSFAFLVQLQLALYVQLMRHNDSSFELVSLQPDGEEEEEQVASPYIVRPQAQAELLILAKFLGYVCAFPYNRAPNAANSCPQEQLQLRRQFQPPFEMRLHLERAMRQGKLLITLPWLVQYLVMLDPVTLQLPAALDTLELLYALYTGSSLAKTQIPLQPSVVFIARSCLGWLLESQPALSTGYYSHRRRMSTKPDGATAALVADCLRSLCFSDGGKAGSLLEQLLPVACPFLHEFRVAIAPSQRHAQRNGRYRYITTRLEQLGGGGGKSDSPADSEFQSVPASDQRKLVDAFLHSQNASMRRLLEFVTERSFKCVVKDAQQTILLPSKSAADAHVNGIESTQQHEVLRELQRIYQQARNQACQQWTDRVPGMLEQRIEQSLRALLPANTNDVVRHTYAHLIRQQAQLQLQQWLEISVLQSSFYHGDLQELATKVCRANSRNGVQASANSNDLCLTAAGELSLSQILRELQQWVHCLSMRPEFLHDLGDLLPLLERTRQAALLPHLPSHFYQLLGSILVRLLQLLMCQQPQLLTQPVIRICCDVWLAPKVRSRGDDEDVPHPSIYLEALLSVSFFQDLSANPARFQLLHQLLHHMLEAHVLDVEQLNQFFMALFKENWTQPVWSALSQLLHQLSQGCANKVNDEDGKSQLFMEMLADLSSDLDSF